MQTNSSNFSKSQSLLAASIEEDIRFWHDDIAKQNPKNNAIQKACDIIQTAMVEAYDVLTKDNPALVEKINNLLAH